MSAELDHCQIASYTWTLSSDLAQLGLGSPSSSRTLTAERSVAVSHASREDAHAVALGRGVWTRVEVDVSHINLS
jgi:hypothetical protein